MTKMDMNRSAVGNGTKLLPGKVDGRSVFARRYKELVGDIVGDLGGPDKLSVIKMLLVRRVAALAAHAERIEADLATGKPADLERLSSVVALLARLGRQIGLDRVNHEDSEPSLADFIAAHDAAKADEPADEEASALASLEPDPPVSTPEPPVARVTPAPAKPRAIQGVEVHALAKLASEQGVTMIEALERRRAGSGSASA